MNKTVTLGGDRVGSGNKMKQAMHNYERSNHNLSRAWRSTMAPGTLVPFLKELMLPGDTFDIDIDRSVLTLPTNGPLFGSFKLQLDVYQVPIRLYQAQLHNNKIGIGLKMETVKLPRLEIMSRQPNPNLDTPVDIQQINKGSLLATLGISGIGHAAQGDENNTIKGYFNAVPYLAYWDIYKNYYANTQEKIGKLIDYAGEGNVLIFGINYAVSGAEISFPVNLNSSTNLIIYGSNLSVDAIQSKSGSSEYVNISSQFDIVYANSTEIRVQSKGSQTIVDIRVDPEYAVTNIYNTVSFPLDNLDNMREDILAGIKSTTPFTITRDTYAPYGNSLKPDVDLMFTRSKYKQQGFALKTYNSDIFNNWLNAEFITGTNGVANLSAIDVSGGTLKMDALVLAKKVYNMLNRIVVSGGRYYDWLEAVYSESGTRMAETPIYEGGLHDEIVFQSVVSNSATEGEPLGTLAGRGSLAKGKGGKIVVKCSEPSYVIGIVSITPRLDYSQGNDWDVNLENMGQLHAPEMDGIGFQDLITDGMAAWSTKRSVNGTTTYASAGKTVSWINYMTSFNKTYGEFGDKYSQMFMTLNRNYEMNQTTKGIRDLTTYIRPDKFNYIFADASLTAQNFWVELGIKIEARRKISAKQIPNL